MCFSWHVFELKALNLKKLLKPKHKDVEQVSEIVLREAG
jgi:hypothetical protein